MWSKYQNWYPFHCFLLKKYPFSLCTTVQQWSLGYIFTPNHMVLSEMWKPIKYYFLILNNDSAAHSPAWTSTISHLFFFLFKLRYQADQQVPPCPRPPPRPPGNYSSHSTMYLRGSLGCSNPLLRAKSFHFHSKGNSKKEKLTNRIPFANLNPIYKIPGSAHTMPP